MYYFRRNADGFTLIELILVIAVLGILMSIAIPRISSITDKAKDANIAQVAGPIRTAMEAYYQDEKAYPPEGDIGEDSVGWNDLNSLLTVLELEEMSSYYIDKFTYTRDDPDDYEIEVVSNSTDTYIIKKNDFYKD
jgi:prepilin-type N-terminal cleavage/methylation domain-containing protein